MSHTLHSMMPRPRSTRVRSVVTTALAVVVGLVLLLTAGPAVPQLVIKTGVIKLDESGTGYFINNNNIDPNTNLPIETKLAANAKTQDPLNNNVATLAYTLPASLTTRDGDVRVSVAEPIVSDVLRFIGNKLYVYSDNQFSKTEPIPPPADNDNIPPRIMGRKTVSLPEGPDDLNNGLRYTPNALSGGFNPGDPGSDPNILLVYDFLSEGDGGEELKYKAFSKGNSVSFDATDQRLTFANDVITDTGMPGDPLVGALVNLPAFSLASIFPNGDFLFNASGSDFLTLTVGGTPFFQAKLTRLVYQTVQNDFVGQLTNFTFDYSLGSPWILGLADHFNPSSPFFEQGDKLDFVYQPDANMFSLTNAFTTSGASGGTNGILVVPEPSTLGLAALALMLLLWRRHLPFIHLDDAVARGVQNSLVTATTTTVQYRHHRRRAISDPRSAHR